MRKLFFILEAKSLQFWNFVLSSNFFYLVIFHLIITGVILFASKCLGIDVLYYETAVSVIGKKNNVLLKREVGYLWAVNWSFYFCFIMTSYFFIFNHTLKESKRFIDRISAKKMIVYFKKNNEIYNTEKTDVWDVVTKKLSRWFLAILLISLSAGLIQWYLYSGQWFIFGFDESKFLKVSTGVDWNVAGSISTLHDGNGFFITIYALFNYLYYGFGWALMFSFYLFLAILFIELKRMTSTESDDPKKQLVADVNDIEFGGFGSFKRIQILHAIFSSISVLSLYLMALRNTYLPHQCKVPEMISCSSCKFSHCEHISSLMFISIEMIKAIIFSGISSLKSLIDIVPTLFFIYSPHGTWAAGTFFNIGFILVFFVFISIMMLSIIESAKQNSNTKTEGLAKILISQILKIRNRTLVILILGALGTLFLNFGSLMLLSLCLWPISALWKLTAKSLAELKDKIF